MKAYPSAYLIGPDGTVIWNGHPTPDQAPMLESKIEAALKTAKEMKPDAAPTTQPAEKD